MIVFWTRRISLLVLSAVLLYSEEGAFPPLDRYDISAWEEFRNHRGFYPYLCEFGYRTLANHIIDPNNREFDPKEVKSGDILYVAVWYLDWFVDHVHDKIENPYILVTCDVGSWIPSPNYIRLAYDPKVACWFAKNMLFTNHSKLFQLPMGQFYYLWAAKIAPIIQTLNTLVLSPLSKDILLYLNYTQRADGRRIVVAEKFYNQPYCFSRNIPRTNVGFEEYWQEVSRSKFVLSPLGLEVDCTRTWECFVLGAIPIVEHSYLDPLYDELPILLIHNWDEINEEFLDRKYDEIRNQPTNLRKAYLDYWAELLHEKQEEIRRGDLRKAFLEANNFSDRELKVIKNILHKHNNSESSLIYRGNFTCLRPFQIANTVDSISHVYLSDIWLKMEYLNKYSQDPSILKTNKITICNPQELKFYLQKKQTYFLDLTHFRHALLSRLEELRDFEHSLEKDIITIYKELYKGNLLIGNRISDKYVATVIQRVEEKLGIRVYVKGDFWYFIKK